MYDHPSLDASLEDFEHTDQPSPVFRVPSHHSGFKSEDSEAGADSSSEPPWSPQAWRRSTASSGWYRHQPYLRDNSHLRSSTSPMKSRESSPKYESAQEDDNDITLAANIPLPRGSLSPNKERSASPLRFEEAKQEFGQPSIGQASEIMPAQIETPNNYIRFAMRAEVQHRTDSIEMVMVWIRGYYEHITRSQKSLWSAITTVIFSILLLRFLFQTPEPTMQPDLIKVAHLARSFEPMIFYSESGILQVGDLEQTGTAVWDLGESVRQANMTSAPLIVQELDDLGESLKTLAVELTKFFATVGGDIDGILIIMEWAKRELSTLSIPPQSTLGSAFKNVHNLFCKLGILENHKTGLPTPVGSLLSKLFGQSPEGYAKATLQRTFNEFLSVLEESINSELNYATALFSLFSTIDRQFLNLQRTTIRELDSQERQENEFLSTLWVRVLGADPNTMRKYEKNRDLLAKVRSRTIANKNLLIEHNSKLIALKQNLENLRRKLIGPLIRGSTGTSVTIEQQMEGLASTTEHLRAVRNKQKTKMFEHIYGVGKRAGLQREADMEGLGIDM